MLELIFEAAQLSADSGWGQAELFACASDTAELDDSPEIEQVMIVKPFHTRLEALENV